MKYYALFLLLAIGMAAQADDKVYPRAIGVPFLGVIPVGDSVQKTEVPAPAPVAEERVVQPGEQAKNLSIEPIYFALDKAELSANAHTKILDLARWMKKHPGARVKVEAYTDPSGTFQHNKVLGAKRASAIQVALSKEGIPSDRLNLVNHGGQPVERKAVITESIVAAD